MVLASLCPPLSVAYAQSIPDAGIIEKQLRDDKRGAPIPDERRATPLPIEEEIADEVRVSVKHFVIEGATLLPLAELQAQLADYTQRELTFRELEEASAKLSGYYREKGFFARVYLPEQDITEGIVRLRVVEGHLGKIILQNEAKRADGQMAYELVQNRLKSGEPYSSTALERVLLLANDLPGVEVYGTLTAGEQVGSSNLVLLVKDEPLVDGDVALSNHGSRATSEYQNAISLHVNNLSGRGDQVNVRTIASTNLGYGQLGYNIPVGRDGMRAGVNASYLAYELGGQFSSLEAEGNAYTFGANLHYPIVRATKKNLWSQLSYENRHYQDDALGAALHRKQINAVTTQFAGDASDAWGGGGLSRYDIGLTWGNVDLARATGDFAPDSAGPQTDGGYMKLSLQASRDQMLSENWYLRGRMNAQWGFTNLDSSEKFAAGGPYGVRSYPVNEGLGDSGALLSMELHRFEKAWDVYGFIDTGVVRQYTDTWSGWNTGSSTPNTYWMTGAGVGVTYAFRKDIDMQTVLAVPIGAYKGATHDKNQDGSDHGPRIWIGLTKRF